LSNHNPSQIEQRLHNLEELLSSVTTQFQFPIGSQGLLSIPVDENSANSTLDLQSQATPTFENEEDVPDGAVTSTTRQDSGDTVDGMGVIIFADEAGSGFFGKLIGLLKFIPEDINQAD
jgi:hypothetical protein